MFQLPIQLSIYFGEWKFNEKEKGLNLKQNKNAKSSKQIIMFYSIKDHFDKTRFWIFYEDEIFCFKPLENIIYDGPKELIDENGSLPKSIKSILLKSYKKYELPEVFANLNANQKYNRGTIAELNGVERKIANSLITKDKIFITHENWFEFLSPIEFETLVFMIFNHDNSLCSSFRGGTLKDFDLKVSLKKFDGLNDGDYWIQVKKKEDKENTLKKLKRGLPKDQILIHLKEDDIPNRILGKNWLTNVIGQRQDIQLWLGRMTFKYEVFNFKW